MKKLIALLLLAALPAMGAKLHYIEYGENWFQKKLGDPSGSTNKVKVIKSAAFRTGTTSQLVARATYDLEVEFKSILDNRGVIYSTPIQEGDFSSILAQMQAVLAAETNLVERDNIGADGTTLIGIRNQLGESIYSENFGQSNEWVEVRTWNGKVEK